MDRFTGKVVVITGSGDGMGKDAALTFARDGVKVVVAGRMEELTSVVMFLASDAASNIHGAAIPVDGGYTAQ